MLIIRTASRIDLPTILAIESNAFESPWQGDSFETDLEKNPFSRLWIAQIDDEPAGYMLAWLLDNEIHLQKIAVHSRFRRHGIARRMLLFLVAQGRIGDRVLLELRAGNTAAKALYQSVGFALEGIRPKYYGDTSEDALLFGLSISDKGDIPT